MNEAFDVWSIDYFSSHRTKLQIDVNSSMWLILAIIIIERTIYLLLILEMLLLAVSSFWFLLFLFKIIPQWMNTFDLVFFSFFQLKKTDMRSQCTFVMNIFFISFFWTRKNDVKLPKTNKTWKQHIVSIFSKWKRQSTNLYMFTLYFQAISHRKKLLISSLIW